MRAQSSTGCDGSPDRRTISRGMSQGYDNLLLGDPPNERDGAGPFRSERDQNDPAASGLLELSIQVPVRIANGVDRVRAAVAVALRQEWPFEVNPDDARGDVGEGLARRGDGL